MKKLLMILFVGVALVSFAQMAGADTVTPIGPPGGYGPYQTGQGGEFTLLPAGSALPGYVGSYAAGKTRDFVATGTFQTFCIEHGEFIYGNTPHDAVLNTKAINGGVGPAGDPISVGTAYLYSQFATGALAYNYLTGVRATSADLLQKAIWYLEGEDSMIAGTNLYYQMVLAQFGTDAAAKADNSSGGYGVNVLNLYAAGHANDPAYLRQDVLVYHAVPEPLTILLLGTGLIGLAVVKRSFLS